jgi:hypothetical protein
MTRLSADQIAEYAHQAGFRGEALTIAVAVALAESGGRTDARGDTKITDETFGPSIGLWQIRSQWRDEGTGGQRDEKANRDPATNARHAYQISRHGTYWHPWATYLSGAYRAYLAAAQAAARHASQHPTGDASRPETPQPEAATTRHAGAGQRVVLDEAELTALHTFFGHCADRIRHVRRALADTAEDVEPARVTLTDPGLAALIAQTFAYLDGPGALPKAEERMDWHAQFAARVRTLVERADGADDVWSRPEMTHYRRAHSGSHDLAERLVLDAVRAGQVRRSRGQLTDHLAPSGDAQHRLPAVDVTGLRNGHVPATRLASVGYGERLLRPVARQYLRMAAAARTAGVPLPLNDGYRTYAEQADLYRRYRNGTGNLAAPPGQSNHGLGLSVDINTGNPHVVPWLRRHATTYGFVNDVPSEPWHWTYRHH